MKTCLLVILLALTSATGFAHEEEAAIALSIAAPALAPGKERSVVAFDRYSHFHVILINTSAKPQQIVTDDNSWGDHALSFEITDRSDEKSVAQRVHSLYTKNVLHWRILQPQESLVLDVFFADLGQWQGFPHPARYGDSETVTMRAVFEFNPVVRKPLPDGVWTGRVFSKPEQYVFYNRMPEKTSQSEPLRGFPIPPPITNGNPSIRLPRLVHVPTKLKIERTTDRLSVEIDQTSLAATNLMVGTNMVTGVHSKEYVFPEGEPRPANGKHGWGTDFNLGTSLLHTRPDGIPLPGKKYVVEVDLTVFETDVPPQHAWQPQGSKNYKVLWQQTLKQTVGLLMALAAEGGDPSWPDWETNGLAWPKPDGAGKIIGDRFRSASAKALGSTADIEAIKSAIVAARPRGKVMEIRWLSPRLVMAKLRFPESSYYYVVQKRKEQWEILTYYLDWIS
jgi:hypothetical protein